MVTDIGCRYHHIVQCLYTRCQGDWMTDYHLRRFVKVLEKCTKNLIGHSRLAFNNHESNIDC